MSPPAAWVLAHLPNFPLREEQILLLAAALPRGQLRSGTVRRPRPRALPLPLPLPAPLLAPTAPLAPAGPVAPAFPLGGDDDNSDDDDDDDDDRLLDFGGDDDDDDRLLDFGGDDDDDGMVGLAGYVYYNAYCIDYLLIYA
jgi:hypothetical protein